jgi:transmembrane sensor
MTDVVPAPESIPGEIRAEAAAWVARLHSSGRTSSLQTPLSTWLAANPLHAQAFEMATEAWELAGAVSAASLPRIDPSRRRSGGGLLRPPAIAAGAFVAVIALVAILLFLRDPVIATGTGEQRSVVLQDGTRVSLNTDTRLAIHFTPQRRVVQLRRGEALFDVAKNAKRPFVVIAGDQSVVALGTVFMVRRQNDEVDVTLVEGKVTVATVEATAKVLAPGERLRVAGSSHTLDRPSIEAVTAWRRGEVVLDHTPLAEAIAEMNRYSAVKIVASGQDLASIQVSGIFRTGDSSRFAQAVADTYQLDVVDEPERIRLARKTTQ